MSPDIHERRAEPRITSNNTPAELTILSGARTATIISAIVVSVSKSGLRLIADTRMGAGRQVRIKMDELTIFGEVRHSHARGAEFESGVKILEIIEGHGRCNRLTDAQIELLALGRGLRVRERLYANFHLRRCGSCAEQFRATKTFFAKVRCA
jgi:hypothetical protein